jgi:hypothetical protein
LPESVRSFVPVSDGQVSLSLGVCQWHHLCVLDFGRLWLFVPLSSWCGYVLGLADNRQPLRPWTSSGGRYSISVYVRNFTDKQYISCTLLGDPTSLGVSWADQRTFDALIFVRFQCRR